MDKVYPRDLRGEPHADGMIWSRFLWDLRALIGNDDALRVAVESHFLLTSAARFVDGADAILLANEALRDGQDDLAIRALLEERGLLYRVPLADPPQEDGFEPNDDAALAASIAPGVHPGLVHAANDDWYRLDVPPRRRLRVTARFDPDAANLDLELYVPTGLPSAPLERVARSASLGGVEEVEASAGSDGAIALLRVHDGDPGTHVAGYALALIETDVPELRPGRAVASTVPAYGRRVFRVEVPSTKVTNAGRLRVVSASRGAGGAATDLRIVAPSGAIVVDFGQQRRGEGVRAGVRLDQAGSWLVEVRARNERAGEIRVRVRFR
jgi:hypothetical protein